MFSELGFINDGFHYHESNTPLTWNEAEAFCAERNSSLATIKSLQQQHYLGNIVLEDGISW